MLTDKGTLTPVDGYEFHLWESNHAMLPERFKKWNEISTDTYADNSRIRIGTEGNYEYFYIAKNTDKRYFLLQSTYKLHNLYIEGIRYSFDLYHYGGDNTNQRMDIALANIPTFEEYGQPMTGDFAIVELPQDFAYSPNVAGARQTYTGFEGELAYCYNTRAEDGRLLVYLERDGVQKTFGLNDADIKVIKQWYKEETTNQDMYDSKLLFIYGDAARESKHTPRWRIANKTYYSGINTRSSFRRMIYAVKGVSSYNVRDATLYSVYVDKKKNFTLAELDLSANVLDQSEVPMAYLKEHHEKYTTVSNLSFAYDQDHLSVVEFTSLTVEQIAEKWSAEHARQEQGKRERLLILQERVDYKGLLEETLNISQLVKYIDDNNRAVIRLETEILQRYKDIKECTGRSERYSRELAAAQGYIEDNTQEGKLEALKQLLHNGFFEFKGQERNTLYFLSKDIIQTFNGASINTGKIVVAINFSQQTIKECIRCFKYSGFKESSNWHTHLASSGHICWGDSLEYVAQQLESGNFLAIIAMLQSLLTSHSPSNPYIGFDTLKATPYSNDKSHKQSWDEKFDKILQNMEAYEKLVANYTGIDEEEEELEEEYEDSQEEEPEIDEENHSYPDVDF